MHMSKVQPWKHIDRRSNYRDARKVVAVCLGFTVDGIPPPNLIHHPCQLWRSLELGSQVPSPTHVHNSGGGNSNE
jgi:hypothetical protein